MLAAGQRLAGGDRQAGVVGDVLEAGHIFRPDDVFDPERAEPFGLEGVGDLEGHRLSARLWLSRPVVRHSKGRSPRPGVGTNVPAAPGPNACLDRAFQPC